MTATAAGPLKLPSPPEHAFTQAYYYALFAAGLYFLVASLMMVTAYGATRKHYDREFKLTVSQRTLMLQTISLLIYLLAGAAVYAHIESWQYLDALYWTDYTLLTVGLGDYAPKTHLGRGLLFPFAIGGIIILGLVIGSIRSLVLEHGKAKMGSRMVEKYRRALLKKMHRKNQGGVLEPIRDATAPISRTSTNTLQDMPGLTERERRRMEFELMRKIQDEASRRRRWLSLIVSGSTWFVLWIAGAAIFQAAEDDQGWSYFVSLYFTYTSLLTIGYGDFYPLSNSGRAFFVFWSLLAIPSLTILISNMGDTIVKGIHDLTLWVGDLTVLPGEQGIKSRLKEVANKATRRQGFNDEVHETPPGILGESNEQERTDGDEQSHHRQNGPESAVQRVQDDYTTQETGEVEKRGKGDDQLLKSRVHYHCILMTEIQRVMKHLKSAPPRKYTFDEWAWYLKLIGEDESSPQNHRKAPRKPRPDGEGLGSAMEDKSNDRKWSWIGNRSPLIGSKEESEWVLERLTRTLNHELEAMRREELEARGDWGKNGPFTNQHGSTKDDGPSMDSSRTATKENTKP